MSADKFWISEEQIRKILNLAHLENEKEIKDMFNDIKKSQKIKN